MNKDYEIISVQQLQAMLATKKGARIITLTTITTPDLKKDCPYKDVIKISRINGIVNYNYASSVNKQREREGKEPDFVPQKRKWGTRLDGLPFISHVNKEGQHKLYLEVKIQNVLSTEYKDNEGSIDKEKLQPYFKSKSSMAEYQGLEKEVFNRDYDINNIVTIDIDGQGFILRKE